MKTEHRILAKKITVPIIMSCVSFAFFLFVLEISLRLISFSINHRFFSSLNEPRGTEVTILCLGDSYTVGGQGSFEASYPKILEIKLKGVTPLQYKVFNGGVCEANSTQVLRRLRKIISLRHIDHVILEVGSANRFNLVGYNFYKNKRNRPWEELRVLKMLRILCTNIRGLWVKSESSDHFNSLPMPFTRHGNDTVTKLSTEKRPAETVNEVNRYIESASSLMKLGEYAEAENILKDAIKIHPDNLELHFFLGKFYFARERFDEAEALFEDLIRLDLLNYKYYLSLAVCLDTHYKYALSEINFMSQNELLPIRGHPYYMISENNADNAEQHKTRIEQLILKTLSLAPNNGPEAIRAYSMLSDLYKGTAKHKKVLDAVRKLENVPENVMALLYWRQGDLVKAEEGYKKWLGKNTNNQKAYEELANFYNTLGRTKEADSINNVRRIKFSAFDPGQKTPKKTIQDRVAEKLLAIRTCPRDFHEYYRLIKAFDVQNKYSASQILDSLEKIMLEDPNIKKNATFMHYCSFFKDRQKWETDIYKWLEHDLDEMADLCSKNGINLIIQDYPYPYQKVNETLKKAAQKRGLLFVENQSIFDKLTHEESWGKYFFDDDHCTTVGHEVMVDNILKVLKDNNVIPTSPPINPN